MFDDHNNFSLPVQKKLDRSEPILGGRMAKPPVTPAELVCSTCRDEGMVYRPETDTEHFIVLRGYDDSGEPVDVEHLVTTRLGGMDACPACTARTEATYRLNNHQRVEDRSSDRLKVVK
jgi:hypothetical protein